LVVREVKIAELKARLSYYLRLVKTGEKLVIKDRDHPFALVTAISDRPAASTRFHPPHAGVAQQLT